MNVCNAIRFLDSILSSHLDWGLTVVTTDGDMPEAALLRLLERENGYRDGSPGRKDIQSEHSPNSCRGPFGRSLFVLASTVTSVDELVATYVDQAAALFLVDGAHLEPEQSKRLNDSGFMRVDAVSVPAGTSFWLNRFACERIPVDLKVMTESFAGCVGKGGGMGMSQYFRVAAEVLSRAQANVLVFGAGADSALYAQANSGGRTVVVEHHAEWAERAVSAGCEVIDVAYSTVLRNGVLDRVGLPSGLPQSLFETNWSVILIDSPEGHTPDMPGRQQSGFAAAKLAGPQTTVFLHDYNREHERAIAERYLGAPDEVFGDKVQLAVFHPGKVFEFARTWQQAATLPSAGSSLSPSDQNHGFTSLLQDDFRPVASGTWGEPVDVSVVIPTFNEGDWLKRTVESVLAAKTELDFDVIVVDDASNDGSVDAVRGLPGVRVVGVGQEPVGCVIGRNLGAKVSSAEYLCFLDSHVLVPDGFLDQLRETCRKYDDRALVSGNILNVDHQDDPEVAKQQYAYTLRDWGTASNWHYHGKSTHEVPYAAPLCPAGLMFTRRSHFLDIGGFSEKIRKWGGTDVEVSLKNYLLGGTNCVDPRVAIYHYYKNRTDKKPTFSISYKQTYFNRLFITRAYGSEEVYQNAKAVLSQKAKIDDLVADAESAELDHHIQRLRKRFVRTWEDFAHEFAAELKGCFSELEQTKPQAPSTVTEVAAPAPG